MAKLHVLESIPGTNRSRAVLHAPVPDGKNSAGVPWFEVIVAVGLNATSMKVGDGLAQITADEAKLIAEGRVLETQIEWGEDVNLEAALLEQMIREGTVKDKQLQQLLDHGAARILPKLPPRTEIDGVLTINLAGASAEDAPDEIVVDRRPDRGLDTALDARLDDAHEKAKVAYLDREAQDLVDRTLNRYQWFGYVVA